MLIEMAGDPAIEGLYVLRPGASKLQRLSGFTHVKGQLPFLWWPSFLPDSRHFLLAGVDPKTAQPSIMLGLIDAPEIRVLTPGDSRAEYAAPGYVLFLRSGRLFAQSFNARTLAVAGEPEPLADQVSHYALLACASYSVSQEGTLLYGPAAGAVQVQWYDRVGRDLGKVELPEPRCEGFRLSPDGKRLAAAMDEQTSGTFRSVDHRSGSARHALPDDSAQRLGERARLVAGRAAHCLQRRLERHSQRVRAIRRFARRRGIGAVRRLPPVCHGLVVRRPHYSL